MNKIYIIILVTCLFIFSGCVSNNAQRGAVIGGLGGMAGSALGKGDRTTTAVIGGIAAVTGYIVGNELDKQQQRQYYNNRVPNVPRQVLPRQSYYNTTNQYQQRNPNHIYIDQQQHPNERTSCKKVTTKKIFSDGSHEVVVEEICEGRRVTNTY